MASRDIDRLWRGFAGVTRARIALGRSGDALPTRRALEFAHAHAGARDAVTARVDWDALSAQLAEIPGLRERVPLRVHSAAADRPTYLRRPDLGRKLAAEGTRLSGGPFDVVLMVADGLSASAVQRHAAPMLRAIVERLPAWRIGPLVLAEQARVALGDEVGAALHAAFVVVLIGERPGLSVPNSLGLYLTFEPRPGRRDSERNCISNIHADGLPYAAAADKLSWLMTRARALRLTGVDLKEDAPAHSLAAAQKLVDSEPG